MNILGLKLLGHVKAGSSGVLMGFKTLVVYRVVMRMERIMVEDETRGNVDQMMNGINTS